MPDESFTPQLLYDDGAVVVCVKPVGFLSESGSGRNLPDALSSYYAQARQPSYIGTVHRLDRIVGGVMLLSRKRELTGKLIAAVAERQVEKEYFAVLRGRPELPAAVVSDLLFRDAAHNKTYVVNRMRKGVREAKLAYRLLATAQDGGQTLSLVRVRLLTGRTHQIRAQFSARQLPLLGDVRYGSKDSRCQTALWSCRLALRHPATGLPLDIFCPPPRVFPWNCFDSSLYAPFPAVLP